MRSEDLLLNVVTSPDRSEPAMGEIHPPFDESIVIGVANALGDTDNGLTGSEIGRVLARLGVADPGSSITKRHRLGVALINRQRKDRSSNVVLRFVAEAVAIGNYINDPDRFATLQRDVNRALALAGFRVLDTGKIARSKKAATFDDIAALTNRLLEESTRRGVHKHVLRFCREELLRESTFHAISEATKGVCDRLRTMTGLTTDGADLVNECFATTKGIPLVRINDWETKSEASEHKGVADLIRGVIGTFRNPTAHAPRIAWPVSEADALDLFATLSYIHRRLDNAVVAKR